MKLSTTAETILAAPDFKSRIVILISLSEYDDSFLAQKLDLNLSLFHSKKELGTWGNVELEKLLNWVGNEEFEDYMLGQMMEETQNNVDSGYLTSKEFKREMGWDGDE